MAANESSMVVSEDGTRFDGTDVCVENLFDYLDRVGSLRAFLADFPSVSLDQATEALRSDIGKRLKSVVQSRDGYVSGTPTFVGTRAPVKNLFDYLAGGHDLDEFLDDFPGVSRDQAIAALDLARDAVESAVYETAAR